jgi:hypothetical protein
MSAEKITKSPSNDDDSSGKHHVVHADPSDPRYHSSHYNPDMDVSHLDEAALVRKLDWRLIPWLSLLYLLSFLDRTAIGNAKVGSIIILELAARPLKPVTALRFRNRRSH